MKALAAVAIRPNVMDIREIDVPAIGEDEALVRLEACGICGTDYEQSTPGPLHGGGRPIAPATRPG